LKDINYFYSAIGCTKLIKSDTKDFLNCLINENVTIVINVNVTIVTVNSNS